MHSVNNGSLPVLFAPQRCAADAYLVSVRVAKHEVANDVVCLVLARAVDDNKRTDAHFRLLLLGPVAVALEAVAFNLREEYRGARQRKVDRSVSLELFVMVVVFVLQVERSLSSRFIPPSFLVLPQLFFHEK